MRTKFIAGIAAAVITVSGLGMTAAYAKGDYEHGERKFEHLAKKLNLSEEQTEQLKSKMEANKEGMQSQWRERKEIRQQLMQLDPSSPDYQNQLESLVLKAQAQAKAMVMAKAEQQKTLHDILTPEQSEQFMAMRSKMQERMRERYEDDDDRYEHHGKKRCH